MYSFSSNSSSLYLDEMRALIEEKKLRRKDLTIFVLSGNDYSEGSGKSELSIFFEIVAINIHTSSMLTRFQLAVEIQGHWFSIDCYIKNNQLYLLVLDAIGASRSTEIVKEATLNLKPIIFSYGGVPIQYDFNHCSFFTLDHLFRLSRRVQHWNDLLTFNSLISGSVIYFDHESCPHSLAFIFKNIQSLTGLKRLPDSLKKTVISKQQTLAEYVMKNTRIGNFLGMENKLINIGIILKERKYMKRGAFFFNLSYYNLFNSSRQGFEVMGGKLGEIISKLINHNCAKNSMQEILESRNNDVLNNFLIALIENKILCKKCITISNICGLINKENKDFFLFKKIFEFVKNKLTNDDFLKIKQEINSAGDEQFKKYFSPLSFEEVNQKNTLNITPFNIFKQ